MMPHIVVATDTLKTDPKAVASMRSAVELGEWAKTNGYHYVPGSRGLFVRDEIGARLRAAATKDQSDV